MNNKIKLPSFIQKNMTGLWYLWSIVAVLFFIKYNFEINPGPFSKLIIQSLSFHIGVFMTVFVISMIILYLILLIAKKHKKILGKNCYKCNNEAVFIHHMDKDFTNNRSENLESLCRECFDKEVKGETNKK